MFYNVLESLSPVPILIESNFLGFCGTAFYMVFNGISLNPKSWNNWYFLSLFGTGKTQIVSNNSASNINGILCYFLG